MNFDNERLFEDEQVSLSETVGKEAEIAQTPADAESAATASTETESAASFDGVSPVGNNDYEAGRSRLAAEDFVYGREFHFPEGAAISFPLRRDGFSRFKSFLFGALSGVVEPFSAVIGALLVIKIRMILPLPQLPPM